MDREKNIVEDSSNNKKEGELSRKPNADESDWDWDEYVEEILYYGIESWKGG